MTFPFDRSEGLILVNARISGTIGEFRLVLALDTGATSTVINVDPLVAAGYDPATTTERKRITTGSGVEYAAVVRVSSLEALGQEVSGFPVLAHTLPPSTGVDGVLGLDFLRARRLEIDFTKGESALS